MKLIPGGVCAAKGFKANGIHCGIRRNHSKKDLALVVSDVLCNAAAVYTTNLVKAAPIAVCKENLADGGTIYVLGGNGAVPATFEEKMGTGYKIKRLAGSDRFETNILILKEAGVYGDEILVCTGKDFADSLSASATGAPILLVPNKALTDTQKNYLATIKEGTKLYIIGGEGAVRASIEDELKDYGSVFRIAGADRFATSVEIAKAFFKEPGNIVFAYAANYPDGLSGGPLALAKGAPLILTQNAAKKIPIATEYVENNTKALRDVYVLGGPSLISDDTVNTILGIEDKKN